MTEYRTRIYDRYVRTRWAPSISKRKSPYALREPFLRKLVRLFFPPSRTSTILDLGCGDGALLHFAGRAGYTNAKGVDCSPEQVEYARANSIPAEQGDLMEFLAKVSDNSVDVVLTLDVIEHLNRSELVSLIDEVRRVLRSGGRWIAHVPNGESPFFGRIRYGDFTHEQAFTRGSIHQLLTASGFATVSCYEDTPVVHGLKSAARFALWKAVRTALSLYLVAEVGSGDGIFSQNLLAVAYKA